jgi:uncharacterized protein
MIRVIMASDPSVLLAFAGENVRSFHGRFELSLISTTLAEPGVPRDVPLSGFVHPTEVLPAAGLFGANASGKSNVLKAMSDMRTFVLHSFRSASPVGGFLRKPFVLDPDSRLRPSIYEIDLVLHGVKYEYGFSTDDERVLTEWAYYYPHGKAARIFDREGADVVSGNVAKAHTRATSRLLRSNALFLSTAASANHPALLPLYEWFSRNLLLAEVGSRAQRQAFTAKLLEDPRKRGQVLEFLRAADLGIVGVETETISPDPAVRERLERGLRIMLGQEEDEEAEIELPPLDRFGVWLTHQGADGGEVALPASDESIGTMVWFGLVGPVIHALSNGAVLLADELDASLHPGLVERVVSLFQSPATNPKRAQLVFNAHESSLLDGSVAKHRLLGRDQIWFTEKLEGGSTRLYALADLDPRKNESVGKRYAEGRYGAVPVLSRSQFEDAAQLVLTED